MINQRLHFVAVVSVFLAVAVGLWIGVAAVDGGTGTGDALRDDTDRLRGEIDRLETDAAHAKDFATGVAPATLGGVLDDERVLLVGVGGATGEQLDEVAAALSYSRAEPAGRLQLSQEFTDPGNSGRLVDLAAKVTPKGVKPPNDNDGAETVSALLAMSLLDKHDVATGDRDELITALERLGMLAEPAELGSGHAGAVIMVSGKAAHESDVVTVADRFGREGATVLAASRPAGVIDAVRADPAGAARVSTVDNVDTPAGRVAAVLALPGTIAGEIGHYGTGDNVTTAVPVP
ncbi:MAG: copper transporter [Stackebrandtia sp.]